MHFGCFLTKLFFLLFDLPALERWGFAKCISVKATIKIKDDVLKIYTKYIQLAAILLPPVAERNLRQKSPKHKTLKIYRPTAQWDTWEQPYSLNKTLGGSKN